MSGRTQAHTALVESYLRDKPDTIADYLYNTIRSVYDLPVFDECNEEQLRELADNCDKLSALAEALAAQARRKPKREEK